MTLSIAYQMSPVARLAALRLGSSPPGPPHVSIRARDARFLIDLAVTVADATTVQEIAAIRPPDDRHPDGLVEFERADVQALCDLAEKGLATQSVAAQQ